MRTLLALCGMVLLAGCTQAPPPAPPDTRAADTEAIHQIEAQWQKESEAHQLEAVIARYTDGAVIVSPGAPALHGKDEIRKSFAEEYKLPGFSLTWKAEKIEVAKSGDIAYSRGPYLYKVNGPNGKPTEQHGTFLTVWKKQPGGTWLVSEDISTAQDKPAEAKK